MFKTLVFTFAAAFILMAVAVSAQMSSGTFSGSTLGTSPSVMATVDSKSGDSLRVYIPEGNHFLCRGDVVPIFKSQGSSPLLSAMNLSGEMRVDNFFGDKYAEGRIIVGQANVGDIAIKPGRECTASLR